MKPFVVVLAAILSALSGVGLSAASSALYECSNIDTEVITAKRNGVPLMVLFTSNDCVYCEKLMTEVLVPELESGHLQKQAHLVIINIQQGGKMIDFDGDPVRRRMFVGRYKVFATPTVMLMDYQGNSLGKPLVGYGNSKNYPELLERAISSAAMGMASIDTKRVDLLASRFPTNPPQKLIPKPKT